MDNWEFTWYYPANPTVKTAWLRCKKDRRLPASECLWYNVINARLPQPGINFHNTRATEQWVEEGIKWHNRPAEPIREQRPAQHQVQGAQQYQGQPSQQRAGPYPGHHQQAQHQQAQHQQAQHQQAQHQQAQHQQAQRQQGQPQQEHHQQGQHQQGQHQQGQHQQGQKQQRQLENGHHQAHLQPHSRTGAPVDRTAAVSPNSPSDPRNQLQQRSPVPGQHQSRSPVPNQYPPRSPNPASTSDFAVTNRAPTSVPNGYAQPQTQYQSQYQQRSPLPGHKSTFSTSPRIATPMQNVYNNPAPPYQQRSPQPGTNSSYTTSPQPQYPQTMSPNGRSSTPAHRNNNHTIHNTSASGMSHLSNGNNEGRPPSGLGINGLRQQPSSKIQLQQNQPQNGLAPPENRHDSVSPNNGYVNHTLHYAHPSATNLHSAPSPGLNRSFGVNVLSSQQIQRIGRPVTPQNGNAREEGDDPAGQVYRRLADQQGWKQSF
ncbi:Hypothetical predicted protein [Lecanosticta acicola]|uniref:Uncharacterized protein n=1 Tax=Lecanosticta acicola TaxID=111012 RepID=A0AAI8YX44_9PEZI|nr:Hypothetical predicted protein [Lecanosticta acicola]